MTGVRAVLTSRFFVVPALIAGIAGIWNLYVGMHANGVIEGRVIDAAGRPAAGATVILFERDFVNQVERGRTSTDSLGGFRFADNGSHLIQLEARTPTAQSDRVTVRLWFRAQDRLVRPLVLRQEPRGGG